MISTIRRYQEYYGDRIAWKIGDFTHEDSPQIRSLQIDVDFNVDSGTFADYERNPFRTVATYLDHSFAVILWRWGIWVAVRAGKANR